MVIKVGLPSVRVKKITVGSPIFRTAAAGSTTLFNIPGANTSNRQRGHILVFDSAAAVGGAYTTTNVLGVNGITTAFAADSDTFTVTLNALTTNVPEGTNLYYTRARMDSDHLNVRTDLIPLRDSEFSLGSPTKKWKALHVSGSTISMENSFLSNTSSAISSGTTTSFTASTYPTFISGRTVSSGGGDFTVTVGGSGHTLSMRDGDSGTYDVVATLLPAGATVSGNSFTYVAVQLRPG